jgi:hypothetical protein
MLERKIVALQMLLGAKSVLDMDARAFAIWLVDQAQEIAPEMFEEGDADDADDVQVIGVLN